MGTQKHEGQELLFLLPFVLLYSHKLYCTAGILNYCSSGSFQTSLSGSYLKGVSYSPCAASFLPYTKA